MRGNVIHFDTAQGFGFIAGEDGGNYAVASENLRGRDMLSPGDTVEFQLSGGRAYDVLRGPVHLFALDADPSGPEGIGREGRQARWLRRALAASPARWKIVYLHSPPHTSGERGPAKALRWPFREWGADAVIAGRDRHYERIEAEGLTWFVNGLGGAGPSPAGPPVAGSRCLFDEADGAMLVEADRDRIDFRFVTVDGVVVDGATLRKSAVARAAAGQPSAIPVTASP